MANIEFFNDSAASNPGATIAAIETLVKSDNRKMENGKWNKKKLNLLSHVTFPMSLILIAGGKDKNLNYGLLAQTIKTTPSVKKVILFGENKNKIKSQIANRKSQIKIELVKDLNAAVRFAYQSARKLINSSTHQLITILFSPASASFDMFKNYEERGIAFKKLVKSLK